MTKRVFRIAQFKKQCKKEGCSPILIRKVIDEWAGACEGLTKDEALEKYNQPLAEEWLVDE